MIGSIEVTLGDTITHRIDLIAMYRKHGNFLRRSHRVAGCWVGVYLATTVIKNLLKNKKFDKDRPCAIQQEKKNV